MKDMKIMKDALSWRPPTAASDTWESATRQDRFKRN